VGATLAFTNTTALMAAAVNVLVLPVYKRLEDRRLSEVFAESYVTYSNEVAAFVPGVKSRRGTLLAPGAERA
jgi:protein-S-isoprenylcysteine O-methyltransferase Ste14